MIIINDIAFLRLEDIDYFIEELNKQAYKEEYKVITDIYYSFLLECYDADIRLQEMILEKLGEDYIPFVILPILDTEDLDSLSFELAANEGVKIKKRDELIFKELCDICFGNIKPFYTRVIDYFDEE